MGIRFSPRNDFVLVRIVDKGMVRKVAVPGRSRQGKEYFIVAIGPQVKELNIGDRVECIGKLGEDVVLLPDHNDLFVTKQANVILVVTEEEDLIEVTNDSRD